MTGAISGNSRTRACSGADDDIRSWRHAPPIDVAPPSRLFLNSFTRQFYQGEAPAWSHHHGPSGFAMPRRHHRRITRAMIPRHKMPCRWPQHMSPIEHRVLANFDSLMSDDTTTTKILPHARCLRPEPRRLSLMRPREA